MKLNRLLYGTIALMLVGASLTACTDSIAFGNASLDKAAGAEATKDTVFSNAEYTRQFLVGIYSEQYYAGNLTANVTRSDGLDGPLFSFTLEHVWQAVRAAHIFLNNVDGTPGIDNTEKARLKAEARCLMVARLWDCFQRYGGIPVIDHDLDVSADWNLKSAAAGSNTITLTDGTNDITLTLASPLTESIGQTQLTQAVASPDHPVTLTFSDGTTAVETEGTYEVGATVPILPL